MNTITAKWAPMLGLAFVIGCASTETAPRSSLSMWTLRTTPLDRTASELDNDTYEHLAWAKTCRARILEVDGRRTVKNTLVPYNKMMMHLDAARSECELFAHVHPDDYVRNTAERDRRKVLQYLSELMRDPELCESFRALDLAGADPATRYVVRKIRRDFRRAGADRPDDVRQRIAELTEEIFKLGRAFVTNIREDQREILLDSLAELDGMPRDWIDRHRAGADGKIHVTTRYPDYKQFMTYARNAEARSTLYRHFKNRGYPKNIDVLHELLARRYELAQILGYANWADYVTGDSMVRSADNVQSFIDRIAELSREPARRDYHILLERKQQDVPGATTVESWEKDYYAQLVKTEQYAYDPQSLRSYFNPPDVFSALFELTEKVFGITYRRIHGLNLWHQDVTAWDICDGGKRIGRFYLDPYPRKDKYAGTAVFNYRTGIAGVRLPQVVFVCNVPNPCYRRDRVALMDHDQVVAVFREFGRLLHGIFAGHHRWMGNAGLTAERDFVEAPAQLLEAWCYNIDTLSLFTKHYRTHEPIPEHAVEQLRRDGESGKGLYVAQQIFYAAISLNLHDRDPENLDTTELLMELQDKYSPFNYVEDTHFQCNFEHLDECSALYYAYMWSVVIAKDMISKFEKDGMLNARTARRFRKTILEPGGSKRAVDLIEDFLGRPHWSDAFKTWIDRP